MCPECSCSCPWNVLVPFFPCPVSPPPPWCWSWVTVLPAGAAGSTPAGRMWGNCLPFILGLTFSLFSPSVIQTSVIRCPEEPRSIVCFCEAEPTWTAHCCSISSFPAASAAPFYVKRFFLSQKDEWTCWLTRLGSASGCLHLQHALRGVLCFHSCLSVRLDMFEHWGATPPQPFGSINRN